MRPSSLQPLGRRSGRGFTLIELLVTIGLIMLLASLILVSFRHIRGAAQRSNSSGALRQMMQGYSLYSGDNRNQLLPGYLHPDHVTPGHPQDLGIRARDLTGNYLSPGDTGSYVWRLMPYLDNDWRTLVADYASEAIEAQIDAELIAHDVYGPGTSGSATLGLAFTPSFGINSVFVGGDSYHGGAALTDRNPWSPLAGLEPIAATRLSQVRNTANLVVFAPSRMMDQALVPAADALGFKEVMGSSEIRPPALQMDTSAVSTGGEATPIDPQWERNPSTGGDTYIAAAAASFDNGGGIPYSRSSGDDIPTARLDGSVEAVSMHDLATNLRHWSPWITGLGVDSER